MPDPRRNVTNAVFYFFTDNTDLQITQEPFLIILKRREILFFNFKIFGSSATAKPPVVREVKQ